MIINNDCLIELKKLSENSIDAIVTDPPYGLSFMGKKWDYDVPSQEIWEECLRVLKPGGYLLAFAGTRTQHRMAVRIEDAGFEIRDMIAWIYGSGFPKSLNIGKAVDKIQGNEREDIGKYQYYDGSERQVRQSGSDKYAPLQGSYGLTKGSSELEGWGTALKPALEPISVCRKPLEKGLNVAQNCLKWGVGGINIDGCRVDFISEEDRKESTTKNQHEDFGTKPMTNNNVYGDYSMMKPKNFNPPGRFPANLIHDGSDEVVELFPNTKTQGHWSKTKVTGFGEFGGGKAEYLGVGEKDKQGGSAARFFMKCEPDDLLFYYAKDIIEICKANNVNTVDDSSSLSNQLVVSVLNDVVTKVSQGDKQLKDLLGLSMNVTPKALKILCENVIIAMMSTEQKYSQESFHIGTVKSKENPVKSVEILKPIDITTTIQNHTNLGGYAVVAILSTTQNNMEVGEKVLAKRFLYTPKASKSERNRGCEELGGNKHCTVKPIALMEYLVKLVSKEGHTVLDPFMGSGSTGIACKKLNREFIGIELDADYCKIAEARINGYKVNEQRNLL